MLKSPSGFQSECCHQHMCSRHVEGGGSINGVHLSLALLFLIHPSLQPTLYHIIELRSHVVSLLSSYVCVSAFLHLFSDTSPCLLYVAIESFILLFEFGTLSLLGQREGEIFFRELFRQAFVRFLRHPRNPSRPFSIPENNFKTHQRLYLTLLPHG